MDAKQLQFTVTSLEPAVRKILETGWNGVPGGSARHVFNVVIACVNGTLVEDAAYSMDADFRKAVFDLDKVIDVKIYLENVLSAILDIAGDYSFSVENFLVLRDEERLDMLHLFYSDDLGKVKRVHSIGDKIFVIETYAPFHDSALFFPYFINFDGDRDNCVWFYDINHAILMEISAKWGDALIKLVS